MNIRTILHKLKAFNEQETVMDLQKVKQIFNANYIDYDIEEDEKLSQWDYKTPYNNYKYYSVYYDIHYIMLYDDFKELCLDLVNMLSDCLPNGLNDFFDFTSLEEELIKNTTLLNQLISFINHVKGEGLYPFKNIEVVTVDDIDYIIFEQGVI